MDAPHKILIVEDEMIIGANISLQLTRLGYEVTGIISKGENALQHVQSHRPDIILMDIQLKGEKDGIETAIEIHRDFSIPIIFLTANADDEHFARAKRANPVAFISKPFKKLDLQHAVELTLDRLREKSGKVQLEEQNTSAYVQSDSIFVRKNERMIKLLIKDIYYFEADRNYCKVHAKDKDCLLVMTLKEINEKLPKAHFLRIHRSYIVNLSHVDEVAGSHVVINKKAIPMSKSLRALLMSRLQTF